MSDGGAERAITKALHTYCQGIDRLDPDLVRAAFHPDAQLIDYAPDPIGVEQFAEFAVASLAKRYIATQHRISNITIEVTADGGSAKSEVYVMAFHVEDGAEGKILHTFNGRYIDHHEPRDGEWKISKRYLRTDWTSIEPIAAEMRGAWIASGRAGTPDPWFD